MPFYEYKCTRCGKEETLMKSFRDADSDEVCPDCGSEMKRVFSAPGILFKGSGFYVNDSRKAPTK